MEMQRSRRASQTVNLTPLIDVVFLLIVFFMLSTSFVVSESMELSIPSDGAKAATTSNIWVLRVQPSGKVNSQGELLSVSEIDKQTRDKLTQDPEQKILLLASANTTVQQLVSVLDVLYINGARKVQIDHDSAQAPNAEVRIK